tara:strand:+ start:498 stop:668 length:171 start_codon:yes stop_codon:yes gene_type:complete
MKVCYIDEDECQIGTTHNYDCDGGYKVGDMINIDMDREFEITQVEIKGQEIILTLV